jgi:hypothetical protein
MVNLLISTFLLNNTFNIEECILGVVATGSQSTNINIKVSDEFGFGVSN